MTVKNSFILKISNISIFFGNKPEQHSNPSKKECRIKHHEQGYRVCLIAVQYPENLDNAEWMMTATDIHDHYLKQSQLTQQVHAQSKMLDASVDCIKLLTPDGRVSHMNRSGCLALGVPVNEKSLVCPG